QATQEVKNW
nr:Chain E, GLN-ALA-THR-GLN-GLU-VAL-LYS-ASN-TRP [unidentified]5INC_F Chain F, GLN-ALA-THR-GLN-GLU-VAL-LYS-ASN-TRP [unidentified]7R7W_C Chain C, GLN-ALA-THR-GLN-GLU-VAL-LYS-ASN-TRP [HIV-1 06TG.HT008]7R7Y_C Chain C, GLN-ALA-THR-GLN-GLU-VAL-LYS-ASN-TRP [HIV-1 06TG.HT008]